MWGKSPLLKSGAGGYSCWLPDSCNMKSTLLAWAESVIGSFVWHIDSRAPIWVSHAAHGVDASLYTHTNQPYHTHWPSSWDCFSLTECWFMNPVTFWVLILEILPSLLDIGDSFSPLSNLLCYSFISLLSFFTHQNSKIFRTRRRFTVKMGSLFIYSYIHHLLSTYILDTPLGSARIYLVLKKDLTLLIYIWGYIFPLF